MRSHRSASPQADQHARDGRRHVCGRIPHLLLRIPVTTHASGHEITRTFTDGQGRLVEVFTINVKLTATSAEGTFAFHDVGSDVTRITKSGVVQHINGQVPFWFNGTAWVDPLTEEVLKEPTKDVFESMLGKACAALNP